MTGDHLQLAQERLALARREVQEAQRELASLNLPPQECLVCGVDISDEYLIDFRITVNHDEEGYQDIQQYRCNQHSTSLIEALYSHGFRTHEHGSTALLEDDQCPGHQDMKDCPTPTYYGLVYLGKGSSVWQSSEIVKD